MSDERDLPQEIAAQAQCKFYRATKNPELFRYNRPDADEYAAVNIISIVNLEWDSRKDLYRLDDESYKALTTERLERD